MSDILDQFILRNVGSRIEDLETPVPVIDIAVAERNITRWQARCDELGIANRPHIKTHKLVGFAKVQLGRGAKGITVQKLGEAEVMAEAGISDMLLTFNVVGRAKLERLAALMKKSDISVVADNAAVIDGLSWAASQAGRKLRVLVECDTGMGRNGCQTPEEAVVLSTRVDSDKHLRFCGLMTYPKSGGRQLTDQFMARALDLLAKAGLAAGAVSSGGTPDMWKRDGLSHVTELRAGTYIYNDRSLVSGGTCALDDCALTILATVVSTPTAERALIDAGSKTLTSDLNGLSGYGLVGDAKVYALSEEHGFLERRGQNVGDLVRVLPNHVCPVSNLFDEVVLVRGDEVLGAVKVDARGKVQ